MLTTMKATELKAMAKELGIKGYSKMNKETLIKAIEATQVKEEEVMTETKPVETVEVLGSIEPQAPVKKQDAEPKVSAVNNAALAKSIHVKIVEISSKQPVTNIIVRHNYSDGSMNVTEYVLERFMHSMVTAIMHQATKLIDFVVGFNKSREATLELRIKAVRPAKKEESTVKPIVTKLDKLIYVKYRQTGDYYRVEATILKGKEKTVLIKNAKQERFIAPYASFEGKTQVFDIVTVDEVRAFMNKDKPSQAQTGEPKKHAYSCASCGSGVTSHTADFLARNQDKIPTQHKGKCLCYKCQMKLGLTKILRKAKANEAAPVITGEATITNELN